MRHSSLAASCVLALLASTPAAAVTVAVPAEPALPVPEGSLLSGLMPAVLAPPAIAASRQVSAAALFSPPEVDQEAGQASYYPTSRRSLPVKWVGITLALLLAGLAALALGGRKRDFHRLS